MRGIGTKFGYAVSVIFLCAVQPAYSQQDAIDKISRKNIEQRKRLDGLIQDTVSFEQVRRDCYQMSAKLNSDIAKIESKTKEIESMTSSRYISSLKKTLDSLESLSGELTLEKNRLKSELNDRRKIMSDIERELKTMDVYANIKSDRLKDKCMAVLARAYSEISDEDLVWLGENVEQLSSRPYYEELNQRIKIAGHLRFLYLAVTRSLNEAFDAEKIGGLRKELSEVLIVEEDSVSEGKFQLSESQYAEFDDLDIILSKYSNGVNELKAIVNRVTASDEVRKYRDEKNADACLKALEGIVRPLRKEQKVVYSKYFECIPYLKATVEAYWKELEDNPLDGHGKVESMIMSM